MQLDAGRVQPFVKAFQAFHRAGIEMVDSGTHQHQMTHLGAGHGPVVEQVFHGAGITKPQRLVHANGQHGVFHDNVVAVYVPEMVGAGDQAHFSHMGLAGAPQKQNQ